MLQLQRGFRIIKSSLTPLQIGRVWSYKFGAEEFMTRLIKSFDENISRLISTGNITNTMTPLASFAQTK